MKKTLVALCLAATLLASPLARAGTPEDIRALYEQFYTAQNAHDLGTVKSLFLDKPSFLWVSDGHSVWGREATLTRMASFQTNAVWRVVPALERAVTVELDGQTAYYHLPLVLELGATTANVTRLKFLVSMLCVKTPQGWKIAALFTTEDKNE